MQRPHRQVFAQAALNEIPRILTLLDRNPHSPTYGCFDRNFWHYKIIDFPSGMSQEFVWALGLVYHLDLPENPYYQQESIREWAIAGILFAARSAHPDGSCDDYFPFERAGGAAAFSLLACVETYRLFELDKPGAIASDLNTEILQFFERRAHWLAHHHESGQLTNHQALIVLCLELVGQLLKTSQWSRAKLARLERVFAWQNSEGWFTEYEGCDPGYHSLTIWCLARLLDLHVITDDRIHHALVKAIKLAAQFIHPDGTYGGEYGSRNTYNFFPHGFELVGRWMPQALNINNQFLAGMVNGLAPCYSDDHILGHHTWNYLLAWQDFVMNPPEVTLLSRPIGRLYLPNAGLLIDRQAAFPDLPNSPQNLLNTPSDASNLSYSQNHPLTDSEPNLSEISGEALSVKSDTNLQAVNPEINLDVNPIRKRELNPEITPEDSPHAPGSASVELYLALNKGGTFKLFKNGQLAISDTQISLRVNTGKKYRTAVGHLVDTYETEITNHEIIIRGQLGWAKETQMTPFKLIVLRGVMLSWGRFFPNLIRKILQKMLIVGKDPTPYQFVRRFRWDQHHWTIEDTISAPTWRNVVSAEIGGDRTSIYVVMSRTFQRHQLRSPLNLTAQVRQLRDGEPLVIQRKF